MEMEHVRRNYFWMLTGRSVSKMGDTFTFLALMLMIFDRTGSAMSVGQVMLTTYLPGILLGPVIGVWVDRLDKRKMTFVCELLRGAVVACIPFVPEMGFVYVLTFLSATIGNISKTAQGALLPEVFPREEMMGYNAKIRSTIEVLGIVGPILAGMVIGWWSYKVAFLFDTGTFVYSALAVMMLKITPRPKKTESSKTGTKSSFFAEMRDGAKYMWSKPRIMNTVTIMFATMIVSGMFNVLFVVFSKEVIQVSDMQFGWLEAALGLGFATGAALMGKWKHVDPLTYVRVSTMLVGLMFAALGVVSSFYAELVVVVLIGVCSVVAMVAGPTLLQTESEPEYIGRVMGFFSTVFSAGTAVSMAMAGVANEAFNVRDILMYGGLFIVATAILLSLKRLPRPSTEQASEAKSA